MLAVAVDVRMFAVGMMVMFRHEMFFSFRSASAFRHEAERRDPIRDPTHVMETR